MKKVPSLTVSHEYYDHPSQPPLLTNGPHPTLHPRPQGNRKAATIEICSLLTLHPRDFSLLQLSQETLFNTSAYVSQEKTSGRKRNNFKRKCKYAD